MIEAAFFLMLGRITPCKIVFTIIDTYNSTGMI